jgi:hypothetical protein
MCNSSTQPDKILFRQGQEERLLGKPSLRWEYTVKIVVNTSSNTGRCELCLFGTGYGVVVGSCEDGNKPQGFIIRRISSVPELKLGPCCMDLVSWLVT